MSTGLAAAAAATGSTARVGTIGCGGCDNGIFCAVVRLSIPCLVDLVEDPAEAARLRQSPNASLPIECELVGVDTSTADCDFNLGVANASLTFEVAALLAEKPNLSVLAIEPCGTMTHAAFFAVLFDGVVTCEGLYADVARCPLPSGVQTIEVRTSGATGPFQTSMFLLEPEPCKTVMCGMDG